MDINTIEEVATRDAAIAEYINVEWIRPFLDKLEVKVTEGMTIFLMVSGKFSHAAARQIGKTVGEFISVVLGLMFQLFGKVLTDPRWWRRLHEQAYRALGMQEGLLRGSVAYARAATGFFLETLKQIIIKVLHMKGLEVAPEEVDWLGEFTNELAEGIVAPARVPAPQGGPPLALEAEAASEELVRLRAQLASAEQARVEAENRLVELEARQA